MTKQKAIRELVKLGWTLVDARKGQSSVELISPATSQWPNSRVVANAQDLLAEVKSQNDQKRLANESDNEYLARLIFGHA